MHEDYTFIWQFSLCTFKIESLLLCRFQLPKSESDIFRKNLHIYYHKSHLEDFNKSSENKRRKKKRHVKQLKPLYRRRRVSDVDLQRADINLPDFGSLLILFLVRVFSLALFLGAKRGERQIKMQEQFFPFRTPRRRR